MTSCTSSLINAFEYNADDSVLTIVFNKTNEIRHYRPVPVELFWDFEAAESKGSFFNTHIAKKFDVQKGGVMAEVVPPPAMDPEADTMNLADLPMFVATHPPQTIPDIQPLPLRITEVPVAEPINEYVTPEEQAALDAPAKKQPEVEKLKSQFALLAPSAVQIVVRDKAHYTEVSDKLQKKVSLRDMVFNLLDPARDAVYKAYQAIQQRQKSILDPMDASIKSDKAALMAWTTEQQRIAREAQAVAQRAADAAAELERQRRTEELRLQMAQEAQETGDTAQAELILADETIQAAPMPVFAPRVEVQVPVVAGQSMRKAWKAEVLDLEALVLDVAAGIVCMRKTGKLEGHAPLNMIEASMPNLNKRAKADEIEALFPGVRAFNDATMSVKKG